jgi:hypothetical protein
MENLTFTDEFIKENNFTAEQITAVTEVVTGVYNTNVATIKDEFSGVANTQAEKIIQGAIDKTQSDTGHKLDRLDSEKNGDYLTRFNLSYLSTQKTDLETSKLSYENKMKDFKGDETVLKELGEFKEANALLKSKESEWDKVLNSGVQKNYDDLLIKNATLNESVAFGSVKPSFDKDANEFEITAKWGAFITETKEKNEIIMHEGVAYAVSKENDLIKTKLEDLVKGNDELTPLIKGRQQEGIDGKPIEHKDVDGVEFKVPTDATDDQLAVLVQGQLAKDGVSDISAEYPIKFQEMYNKAKAGQKTAA